MECLGCHQIRLKQVRTSDLPLSLPISPDVLQTETPEELKSQSGLDGKSEKPKDKRALVCSAIKMDDCLKHFFQASDIGDFNCPTCKCKTNARRTLYFSEYPDYLIIQAQRFLYDNW